MEGRNKNEQKCKQRTTKKDRNSENGRKREIESKVFSSLYCQFPFIVPKENGTNEESETALHMGWRKEILCQTDRRVQFTINVHET
jgi:hypothetical protein